MINMNYESYQVELVALEYRRHGFNVEIQTKIQGLEYEFDAVARRDGELVIIEIINKKQSPSAMQRKLQALQDVADKLPGAKVDFRYIDADSIVLKINDDYRQQFLSFNLQQTLRMRTPNLPKTGDVTSQFLHLWHLHATTIRALGVTVGLLKNRGQTDTILETYNELLRDGIIKQPEQQDGRDVSMDLFEIYENVRVAIQGASIARTTCDQLRGHVLEVRSQIRAATKFTFAKPHVNKT